MRSRREKVARIASIKTLTCLINELNVDCVLLQVKCEIKTSLNSEYENTWLKKSYFEFYHLKNCCASALTTKAITNTH